MRSQYFVVDTKWKPLLVLAAFFLMALAVRWIAIVQTPVIAPDAILYIKAAKLYASGSYYDALRLCPFSLFPLLIPLFYKIFGDWVMAGQWASTLLGALTVIPLYLLARQLFNERVAFYGSIFYIVSPPLVQYSAEVLRDIPFIFFYSTALLFIYIGVKDAKKWYLALAALACIFIAVSALIRMEGILLLIVLLSFALWMVIRETVSWKKIVFLIGFPLLFFCGLFCILVLLSPEAAKVSSTVSRAAERGLRLSLAGSTIIEIEKEVEEKEISPYGKNLFQLAKEHRFSLYMFHIVYKSIKAFTIPLFLLFLFGVVKRKKVGYRGDEFLLISIYGVFIIAFLFHLSNTNYLSIRYPFPLIVPSLIWSGVGFVELEERIARWMSERNFILKDYIIRWMSPLLLIVICIPLLSMALTPQRKDKLELKEIGLWLKGHGYASSIIVGQNEFERLAFYADGEYIEIPKGNYKDIIRFAREKNTKVLVINKKTIDYFSPHFFELVSPRDLQQINIPDIKTPHYATTVFRVKGVGKK